MRRDRLTLAMMTGLPVVQLVFFGYAIRTEVRHLPTVVLEQSRSSEGRALVAMMQNAGTFDVVGHVGSRAELEREIRSGRARAAVVVSPEFAHDVKRGRTARAQVIVDAADPMASASALSGAALAGAARGAALAESRAGRALSPPVEVRVRPWYNPALRSSIYIVPGIVGVLLTLTMLLITSMAIVRERERGTLEQLVVTPVGKTSLMLGKILPFVLVGYVQMTNVLLMGWILFDVPLRGSLPLLYLITLAFIVAMLGLGLLVSTVARTQTQAMQIGFFLLMPNILLSGFMFPREAMPAPAQWLGLLLPLTFYLRVLRGVLLKGLGFEFLWRDAAVLTLFAVGLVAVSVRRFAKTID